VSSQIETIKAKEHENISEKISELFPSGITYQEQPRDRKVQNIWALGLSYGGYLSYYIGLDWLDEKNSIALRVDPKIRNRVDPKISNIDYIKMFQTCLESPITSEHLNKVYDVRIDSTFIPLDDGDDFSIILILHFLYTLGALIRKPLKKGYVSRTENLSAKLKGKIQIGSHIKKNLMNLRTDRMYCTYQEYSSDCLENRILKTAYEACMQYLATWNQADSDTAKGTYRFSHIATAFSGIGTISNLRELQGIKSNAIYRGYAEALRLAKLILRMRGYQDEYRSMQKRYVPPFVIDMSLLFELYVYHHLYPVSGNSIIYQAVGNYGEADFIDPKKKLVIDTKYKYTYDNDAYDINDIRQVSGYARDETILETLGVADREIIVPCLIIYPSEKASSDFSESYDRYWKNRENTIKQFRKMYKLGIKLPERA
jgi:5-methylcytosine-specific restriction enzyme subunit McrC